MTSFVRQPGQRWHQEVPGARWLKADLHVHTLDDHPAPNFKMPEGVSGALESPATLKAYARAFLKGAIRAGIEVVALTPHAVRVGSNANTSAVWHIVDEWNTGLDDDGQPYVDKIYALFPGFEPSFNTGQDGLHLIFIFDPEIGREKYLEAFTIVMRGADPWKNGSLQLSSLSAKDAFADLRQFKERNSCRRWDYAVLAPHCDSNKGLFSAQKAQALTLFEHGEIVGLELRDNKLPAEMIHEKPAWFDDGLKRFHHALYHASDAYKISPGVHPAEHEVGYRFTWLKLASPRIEAIRQAFLASDSRLGIAYRRDESKRLVPRDDTPEPVPLSRPWLRRLTVAGDAAFFGGRRDGQPAETTFTFSPDLTCIIGGSMSGKSTLLDGLRDFVGASPPVAEELGRQVRNRAELFKAGQARLVEDLLPFGEGARQGRFPARFFTQGELQRLTQDGGAIEDLLARLMPAIIEPLSAARERVDGTRDTARASLDGLAQTRDEVERASQDLKRSQNARTALSAFAKAGLEDLNRAERGLGDHKSLQSLLASVRKHAQTLDVPLKALQGFDAGDDYRAWVVENGITDFDIATRVQSIVRSFSALSNELDGLARDAGGLGKVLASNRDVVRARVEERLAGMGYSAESLREFAELQRQAAQVERHTAVVEQSSKKLSELRAVFNKALIDLAADQETIRQLFDRAITRIHESYNQGIRVERVVGGRSEALDAFIRGFRQTGVSRWWSVRKDAIPALLPGELLRALRENRLDDVGMSAAVAASFKELMTVARQDELAVVASGDVYEISVRVDDSAQEYRRLADLSGGKRVNVLLTLLLESSDNRPLVIDQPEDELDNRFLFETVLPALRRLKGRRQVIVATHNANIVVNGDADFVVQLEADASHGRVACSGAIEDESVKAAIVETVDGGRQAFDLRKAKYGF